MYVVGADGCREGWIAVALTDGRFAGASAFASFAELVRSCATAAVIAVDIPIGFVSSGERACDLSARELVGPRRNSVLQVPPRTTITLPEYGDANARCRELMGRGLTRAVFGLRRKILEVDAAVRADDAAHAPHSSDSPVSSGAAMPSCALPPSAGGGGRPARFVQHARAGAAREGRQGLRHHARIINPARPRGDHDDMAGPSSGRRPERIIEAHPEASFCELNGAPLEHSKRTYNGMMQRMRLLERSGISVPTELGEIGQVSVDEVLDAAAVAWTADRYAHAQARSLPPADRWQYDGDRPVAIWV
jgi:predicted RNase H-like nuclease